MAVTDNLFGALRRVPLSAWAWWFATIVLWPVWLAIVLGVQLAAFVGLEAAKAPIYGALSIAVAVTLVVCAAGSWFVGGTTAVNGAPPRLWVVPAAFGAVALLGVAVVDVAQWLQGVPGPLPWSTATTLGFVVVTSLGVLPALAAVAFRIGVRSAGPQIGVAPRRAEVDAPTG